MFPLPVDEIPAADASRNEIKASIDRLKKSFVRYTKEATTKPEKNKWRWQQDNYNIGVYLTNSRYIVVDYDMDPGEDGGKAFELHDKTWPKTRIARTQSGGYHRYYKLPEGRFVRSQQSFGPFKNVQIKGNGTNCYVVGPGSTIHGRKYEWIDPEQEFAELDDEFIRQNFETTTSPELRKKANQIPLCEPDTPDILAAVDRYIKDDAPHGYQGNRDNTAFKVACQVKNYGASHVTALDALLDWNYDKCEPSLDEDVIQDKVHSAYKNSQRPQGDDAPSVRLERRGKNSTLSPFRSKKAAAPPPRRVSRTIRLTCGPARPGPPTCQEGCCRQG